MMHAEGRRVRASKGRRAAVAFVVTLVSTIHATPAIAQRSAPLAVESHVGKRSADAERLVRPVLDELALRGYRASTSQLREVLGVHAPAPGLGDPEDTATAITKQLQTGFQAWITGNADAAAPLLADGLERMQRNPALFVEDPSARDLWYRATLGLALVHARRREPGPSDDRLRELIRSFPQRAFPRAEFGPDAEKLFRAARDRYGTQTRGTLRVKVDDERAAIYVNEQIRGVASVEIADLYPGSYRVFVRAPGSPGRTYLVPVPPGGEPQLDIAWSVDRRFAVHADWVGFTFDDEREQRLEGRLASRLANRHATGAIAVIGVGKVDGHMAVIGTSYRPGGGDVLRRGVVPVDAATDENLRALAAFLADGTTGEGVRVLSGTRADARVAEVAPGTTRPRSRVATFTAVIGGVALLSAGGILFAIDQDDDGTRYRYRDSAPWGAGIGGAGALVLTIGAYLALRHEDTPSRVPTVSRVHGGAVVGWTSRF